MLRSQIVIVTVLLGSAVVRADAQNISVPQSLAVPALDAAYEKFNEGYRLANAQMVTNLYADDAFYLAPGRSIERGRSFISMEFSQYLDRYKNAPNGPDIDFRIVDRKVAGDWAYDVGYIVMNDKRPNTVTDAPGAKYLAIWKRDAAGEWKMHVDMYSDVPRPADPARAESERGIRAAVQAYFDGVTNNDVARLDAAFHPSAFLSATMGNGDVYHSSYEQWKKFTSQPAESSVGKTNRITNIQITGNAAVVTTVLDWPRVRYTDYLSLVKQGPDWKIVAKIWHQERK